MCQLISPENATLHQKLRENVNDPLHVMKEILPMPDATVEQVRLCFQAYFQPLRKVPTKERQRAIQQTQLGRRALDWLMKDDSRRIAGLLEDPSFWSHLSYVLAAEDLQHYVIDWVQQDLPPSMKLLLGQQKYYRWRDGLFGSLVNARMMLITN